MVLNLQKWLLNGIEIQLNRIVNWNSSVFTKVIFECTNSESNRFISWLFCTMVIPLCSLTNLEVPCKRRVNLVVNVVVLETVLKSESKTVFSLSWSCLELRLSLNLDSADAFWGHAYAWYREELFFTLISAFTSHSH